MRLPEPALLARGVTIARVLRTLGALRRREGWQAGDIAAHQANELAALRAFAFQASPFYRDFHRGLEHAPLGELPILTKSRMMEQFDAFVTDPAVHLADARAHLAEGSPGRFLSRYEVVSTSGTTGHPGIFLFNPGEWVSVMASFARAREWAGIKVELTRRSRMAVVSTTNERNVSARVGKAADTPFIPTLRLDATQPLAEIVAALNEWQPEVLVAYASMAYFLATEQLNLSLSIRPRAVFTSSEVLTGQMRSRVEEAWGPVAFDEYASTETATIAAEDVHHHGMHIFEDLLIVENVDADNRPVPAGVFGEKLLVTVLFSRTQPLIRYEISDSVRFAESQPECTLPFRVIDSVQGRREDILELPAAGIGTVSIHPNIFHDVMDAVPNRGWQVVQRVSGLDILVVPFGSLDSEIVKGQVTSALVEHGAAPPTVEVKVVESIPKSSSGKSPLIQAYRPGDRLSGLA